MSIFYSGTMYAKANSLWSSSYSPIGLPRWCSGKESICNSGDASDAGSILGLGRFPGEGNGNPLQYSCLENPTVRGAWWATVQGVAKSWRWLSIQKTRTKPSSKFYYPLCLREETVRDSGTLPKVTLLQILALGSQLGLWRSKTPILCMLLLSAVREQKQLIQAS